MRPILAPMLVLSAWLVAGTAWAGEAAPSAAAKPADAIPSDAAPLRELVAGLDRKMFDAYNAHDVAGLMAMFADDLEFFHDKGGLLNHEQVTAGFTNVFANNKDIRRELVADSLEVYPVKGYGAIETGAHRFCHTENAQPVCGTFRFVQVWRFKDGAWTVTRELSYGH